MVLVGLEVSVALNTFGSRHEKTCLMPYVNNKDAGQPAHLHSLISAFVVRCLDSIIPMLPKSTFSRQLASVAVAGLSLIWSHNPEIMFSHDAAHL